MPDDDDIATDSDVWVHHAIEGSSGGRALVVNCNALYSMAP
jgi:hypothetical protein